MFNIENISIDPFLMLILWKETDKRDFNHILINYEPLDDFKSIYIHRDQSNHDIHKFELFRNIDFRPVLLKYSFKKRNSIIDDRYSTYKVNTSFSDPLYRYFKFNEEGLK